MGLFRRKPPADEVYRTKLCPYCKEPLRESASTCAMCGTDLPEAANASPDAARAPEEVSRN